MNRRHCIPCGMKFQKQSLLEMQDIVGTMLKDAMDVTRENLDGLFRRTWGIEEFFILERYRIKDQCNLLLVAEWTGAIRNAAGLLA